MLIGVITEDRLNGDEEQLINADMLSSCKPLGDKTMIHIGACEMLVIEEPFEHFKERLNRYGLLLGCKQPYTCEIDGEEEA